MFSYGEIVPVHMISMIHQIKVQGLMVVAQVQAQVVVVVMVVVKVAVIILVQLHQVHLIIVAVHHLAMIKHLMPS
jgi:hypothetical protein